MNEESNASEARELLRQPAVLAAVNFLLKLWPDSSPSDDFVHERVARAETSSQSRSGSMSEAERGAIQRLRSLLSPAQLERLSVLLRIRAAELAASHERASRALAGREDSALRYPGPSSLDRDHRAAREARRVRQELQAQIAREKKAALVQRLQTALQHDFLRADEARRRDPGGELVDDDEYAAMKIRFVQAWAQNSLREELDDDQAAAIAAVHGDVQVVARAGSGKTRTLVARAVFLQTQCGVAPDALMLLAFNKKAADEMRERLSAHLGDDLPHVMTFHALAYAVVHPEERLVFDDPSLNQMGLQRTVQHVIDEYVSSEGGADVRRVMLAYFRKDLDECSRDRQLSDTANTLEQRRSLSYEALDGTFVRSFGEKVIANALFEHGIEYAYERARRWNGEIYRPDFTIKLDSGGVAIEYFGLAGDPEYDEQSVRKRDYWREQQSWTLLERTQHDLARLGEHRFVDGLLSELRNAGLNPRRRTDDEIWSLIEDRTVSRFARAVSNFLGRCRNFGWSPADVRTEISGFSASRTPEAQFVEIGAATLERYEAHLRDEQLDDFRGLVWRAAALIREGQVAFSRDGGRERGNVAHLEHLLVDEFQDFAPGFWSLISAIRSCNASAAVFAVGDEWQAINGFAGSSLKYFEDFSSYFRETSRMELPSNYRSAEPIVAASNSVMQGRGQPARAVRSGNGRVAIADVDRFQPSAAEEKLHGRDRTTPALLRLITYSLDLGLDVEVLSRTNRVPRGVNLRGEGSGEIDGLDRFAKHIRSFLRREDGCRLGVSTVHESKGLERTAVIVLGATADHYPLVHPTWPLFRVFGDTRGALVNAERRLFYVALTRAKRLVVVLTEGWNESPFVSELRRRAVVDDLNWATVRPPLSQSGETVEIRARHAFKVRHWLNELGYSFVSDGSDRYWHKAVPMDAFAWEWLDSQPWNHGRVEVQVLDEAGRTVARTDEAVNPAQTRTRDAADHLR